MPLADGSSPVVLRRPDGGTQIIPADIVQTRDPNRIREFLGSVGFPDTPVDVRPLTKEGLQNFESMLGQREAEVRQGMADTTDQSGRSGFQQAWDEGVNEPIGVPWFGGQGPSLAQIASAITPSWLDGKKISEATGITAGKMAEQLIRPFGMLAESVGNTAKAGAALAGPSGMVQNYFGDMLRQAGQRVQEGMEVPGPAGFNAVKDTFQRAGPLAGMADAGALMARGYLENFPQLMASAAMGGLNVAAPVGGRLMQAGMKLLPFGLTAMPGEVGDIYGTAIDEGREGPGAALPAVIGGAINTIPEAGLEAFGIGKALGKGARASASKGIFSTLFGTPAKTALGEIPTEMGQEMVGYAAERAGGSQEQPWSEIGNRAATAGIMAAGAGGASGITAGVGETIEARKIKQGRESLKSITSEIERISEVRGRLAQMAESGTEEIVGPDEKSYSIDYLLGQADGLLRQMRISQADHIKAFGDGPSSATPPPLPSQQSRTADSVTPDQEQEADQPPILPVTPAKAPPASNEMQREYLRAIGLTNEEIDAMSPEEAAKAISDYESAPDEASTAEPTAANAPAEARPKVPTASDEQQDEQADSNESIVKSAAKRLRAREGAGLPADGYGPGAREVAPEINPSESLMEKLRAARRSDVVANAANKLRESEGSQVEDGPTETLSPSSGLMEKLRAARRADESIGRAEEEDVQPKDSYDFIAKVQDTDGEMRDFQIHANEDRVKLWRLNDAGVRTGVYHQVLMPSDIRGKALNKSKLRDILLAGTRVSQETTEGRGTFTTLRPLSEKAKTPNQSEQALQWRNSSIPARRKMLKSEGSLFKGLTYSDADEAATSILSNDQKEGSESAAKRRTVVTDVPVASADEVQGIADESERVGIPATPEAKQIAAQADAIAIAVDSATQTKPKGGRRRAIKTAKTAAEIRAEADSAIADATNKLKELFNSRDNPSETYSSALPPRFSKAVQLVSDIALNYLKKGAADFISLAYSVRTHIASTVGAAYVDQIAPLDTLKQVYIELTKSLPSLKGITAKDEVLSTTELPTTKVDVDLLKKSKEANKVKPSTPMGKVEFTRTPRVAKPEEATPNRRPSDQAFEVWQKKQLEVRANELDRAAASLVTGFAKLGMEIPVSSLVDIDVPPGYAKVGDMLVMASNDPGLTQEKSKEEQKSTEQFKSNKIDWRSDMQWSGLEKVTAPVREASSKGDETDKGAKRKMFTGKAGEKLIASIREANAGQDDRDIESAEAKVLKADKALAKQTQEINTAVGSSVVIDLSLDGIENDRVLIPGKSESEDRQVMELMEALESLRTDPEGSPWISNPLPIRSRPSIVGTVESVIGGPKKSSITELNIRLPGMAHSDLTGGETEIYAPGITVVRTDGEDLIVRVPASRALPEKYVDAIVAKDAALTDAIAARRKKATHGQILLRHAEGGDAFNAIVDIPPVPTEKLDAAKTPEQAIAAVRQHIRKLTDLRREIANGNYETEDGRAISQSLSIDAINLVLEELDERVAQLAHKEFIRNNEKWIKLHRVDPEDVMNLVRSAVVAERDDVAVNNSRIGSMPHPTDDEMEKLNAIPEAPGKRYPADMEPWERVRWRYAKLRLRYRAQARRALQEAPKFAAKIKEAEDKAAAADASEAEARRKEVANLKAQRNALYDEINDRALNERVRKARSAVMAAGKNKKALENATAELNEAEKQWREKSNEEASRVADAIAKNQRWDYSVPGLGEMGGAPKQDRGRQMRRILASLPLNAKVKALWYGAQIAKTQLAPSAMDRSDYTEDEIEKQESFYRRNATRRARFRSKVASMWKRSASTGQARPEHEIMDDWNALAAAAITAGKAYNYDQGAGIREELRVAGVLAGLVRGAQKNLASKISFIAANSMIEASAAHFARAAESQAEGGNPEGDGNSMANRPYVKLKPVKLSDSAAVHKALDNLVVPNWRPADFNRVSASTSRKWAVVRFDKNSRSGQARIVFLPMTFNRTSGKDKAPPTLRIQAPVDLYGNYKSGSMVPIEALAPVEKQRKHAFVDAEVIGMVTLALDDATDSFPLSGVSMFESVYSNALEAWSNVRKDAMDSGEMMPMPTLESIKDDDASEEEMAIERDFVPAAEPQAAADDPDFETGRNAIDATKNMLVYIANELHQAGAVAGADIRQILSDIVTRSGSHFGDAVSELYDALTTPGAATGGGTLLGSGDEGITTRNDFAARFIDAIKEATNELANDQQEAAASEEEGSAGPASSRSFSIDPVVGLGQAVAKSLGISRRSGAWPTSGSTGAKAPSPSDITQGDLDQLRQPKKKTAFEVGVENDMSLRASRFIRNTPNIRWATGPMGIKTAIITNPSEVAALKREFGSSSRDFPTIPKWWRISPMINGGYTIRDFLATGMELKVPQVELPMLKKRSSAGIEPDPFQRKSFIEEEADEVPVSRSRFTGESVSRGKKKESRLTDDVAGGAPQYPLSERQVRDNILEILGTDVVPAHIEIVSELTGATGQQIQGDFDPETGTLRINSSMMGGRTSVLRTLVHESVHQVIGDPEVQAAIEDILANVPPEIRALVDDLYAGEASDVMDEERVAAVAESVAANTPESLISKAWQAIKDAILRIPGMAKMVRAIGFDTSEFSARYLVRHALKKAIERGSPRQGQVRESRGERMFKDSVELQEAKAGTNPASAAELETQASVQSKAIPQWAADQVADWSTQQPFSFKANPAAAIFEASKRRASRSLRWIKNYRDLTSGKNSPNALWAAAKAMPRTTEAERDAATRAEQVAILSSLTVLDMRNKVLREIDKAETDFTKATSDLSDAIDAEDALSARDSTRVLATISTMKQDLEEWVDSVYELSEDGADLAEAQLAREAISALSGTPDAEDAFAELVNKMLSDTDVRNILADANKSDTQKMQDLMGGPIPLIIASNPTLSASPFIQKIQQPLVARGSTPLAAFSSLPAILQETIALRNSKRAAELRRDSVLARYRSAVKYGVLDMGKFADALIKQAEKLGEAKHVRAMAYQKIRQAMINQQSAAMRLDLLERMSMDPEYQDAVRQARNVGQLRSVGIIRSNFSGTSSQRDPKTDGGTDAQSQNLPPNSTSLVMPDNGETITFHHSFESDKDEAMRRSVASAVARIRDWVTNVDNGAVKEVDPIKVEEYRGWVTDELVSMMNPMWAIRNNQTWGTFLTAAFHMPKMQSSFAAALGSGMDFLTDMLGGQPARELRRHIAGVSRITSESYDLLNQIRRDIREPLIKATKSHGIKLKDDTDIPLRKYYRTILNPIVAYEQENRQKGVRPGQVIHDYATREDITITKEDIALAMVLKRWNDKVREVVETPGSELEQAVRVEVPGYQTARGQQGKEERVSVSSGRLTSARMPSPELRSLLVDWAGSTPRLNTRGREPGPVDQDAAADAHWNKYFRTDASTGLPVDQQVWADILMGHILEDNSEYIGRDHSGIGDLYAQLREQESNGWRPMNSDQVLERLGRSLKLREISKAEQVLIDLVRANRSGPPTEAILKAERKLAELQSKTDADWREDARVLLMKDIEHVMYSAGSRYGTGLGDTAVVSKFAKDEFSLPREALLAPGRMMNHLPIDSGGQNLKVSAAVEHMMTRLKKALGDAIFAVNDAITEEGKNVDKGTPLFTGQGKKSLRVMHTLADLRSLQNALNIQKEFVDSALSETYTRYHGVGRWMNIAVRGFSSIVLGVVTNAMAVTKDVLATNGILIPLASIGLGNSTTAIALSTVAGIGRAIRGGLRRAAATKAGRAAGHVLPFISEMAATYDRNRAMMKARGLADNRVALGILMDSVGGATNTPIVERAATQGKLGAMDQRAQDKASAVTQWLFQMRSAAEESTNLIAAIEGWNGQTRKIKRRYRRAIEERKRNGIDERDPTKEGFAITPDELMDHNFMNSTIYSRKDALRNWRDLFAETRGLDMELRDWYERTASMPEAQALEVEMNDLAERATVRRWIARTVRPQAEQISFARLGKGVKKEMAAWLGMHKSQVSATRATLATMLGRSANPNSLTRNLKAMATISVGLLATLFGQMLAYEVPKLEKKILSGGMESATVGAADVATDSKLLGEYLSQVTLVNSGLFPNLVTMAMGANMSYDPMSLSDQFFGFGALEDIMKTAALGASGHPIDAATWLARRRIPVLNQLAYNFDGSKEAESLYRSYKKFAPEELRKESFFNSAIRIPAEGSATARRAANAAVRGDTLEATRLQNQLTMELWKGGTDLEKAEKMAEQKIGQNMPMRRALRREPSEEEVSIIRRRMSPSSAYYMDREMNLKE